MSKCENSRSSIKGIIYRCIKKNPRKTRTEIVQILTERENGLFVEFPEAEHIDLVMLHIEIERLIESDDLWELPLGENKELVLYTPSYGLEAATYSRNCRWQIDYTVKELRDLKAKDVTAYRVLAIMLESMYNNKPELVDDSKEKELEAYSRNNATRRDWWSIMPAYVKMGNKEQVSGNNDQFNHNSLPTDSGKKGNAQTRGIDAQRLHPEDAIIDLLDYTMHNVKPEGRKFGNNKKRKKTIKE